MPRYLLPTVIILLSLQNSIMAIETPNFKLIKKEGAFEIREYEPMIIAMTKVKSGYRKHLVQDLEELQIIFLVEIRSKWKSK